MGTVRLAALAFFLVAAVGAQLYKGTSWTYPLAAWTMYSDAAPAQDYPRYEAKLASGELVDFPFDRVSPSRSTLAFMSGFSSRLRQVADLPVGAERDAAASELGGLLSQVAAIYNQHNPQESVRSVNALLCTVPLDGYSGEDSLPCQRFVPAPAGE